MVCTFGNDRVSRSPLIFFSRERCVVVPTNQTTMKVTTRIIQTIIGTVAVLGASSLQAQIGSNWTEYTPTKTYNSGMSQSQRYSISGNVEHFWTYTTDTDEWPG